MLGGIYSSTNGFNKTAWKSHEIIRWNNPSISFTVEQLKNCPNIDKIIVATTTNSEDNEIESFCKKIGIDVFRGNSDDVLLRYYDCARFHSLDSIIRKRLIVL